MGFEGLEIIVDVRHDEVRKLEVLGFSSLLYSVLATFAREYLGPSLKKWSPRFFGDGALNLELLAKQRSELWILVKDDIGVIQRRRERQLVTSSDVRVVNVGAPQEQVESGQGQKPPKILKIVDEHHQTDLAGHYIRLPDTAYRAYADLIQEYDHRGVMWGGNKIGYVPSDAMSASFQYEIRLDEVIAVQDGTTTRAEGAQQITKPLQLMFDGLYFPIPVPLERYLVPVGEISIRLQVDCDLFDMKTARHGFRLWNDSHAAMNGHLLTSRMSSGFRQPTCSTRRHNPQRQSRCDSLASIILESLLALSSVRCALTAVPSLESRCFWQLAALACPSPTPMP